MFPSIPFLETNRLFKLHNNHVIHVFRKCWHLCSTLRMKKWWKYILAYGGWKCELIKKYSQCEFPIIKNLIVVPRETAQKVKYVIN